MKKKFKTLSLLCTAALALLLLTGCGSTSGSEELVTPKSEPSTASVASHTEESADSSAGTAVQADSQTSAQSSGTELIGLEKAKEIALNQENLTEDQVTQLQAKLDEDHGQQEYEVEFHYNGTEYDFDIDALTGEIRSRSAEPEHGAAQTTQQSSDLIGEDKAIEAALAHAGLSKDQVTDLKSKLEPDDGLQKYKVKFYQGNTEYEYKIDAATGDLLSYEIDTSDNGDKSAKQPSDLIGEDKAIELALTHAGLSQDQVTKLKAKLDEDDGRQEYEVEFHQGNVEYDYEIDAATGAILSYEIDRD